MEDGESRSRGDVVAKATKLSKSVIKEAAFRPNEGFEKGSETKSETMQFDGKADGKMLAVTRLKKTSCKTELMDQIGVGLRSVYDDVLAQPVPDRFFDLLRQLECSASAQSKKDAP